MKNFELKISRNFRDDKDRREYFIFSNKDSNGNQSSYKMNNKQMKELEQYFIRKSVRSIIHIIYLGER